MAGTLQALWHALCLFPSPWVKGAGESAECVMTAAWKENVCMCVFVSVHVCVCMESQVGIEQRCYYKGFGVAETLTVTLAVKGNWQVCVYRALD